MPVLIPLNVEERSRPQAVPAVSRRPGAGLAAARPVRGHRGLQRVEREALLTAAQRGRADRLRAQARRQAQPVQQAL
jgi:hypothetical protein